MAIAWLQGSFRAPDDATIRLTRTDTSATVDFTISEGDTWNSADDLLTEWTDTIQADGSFGSGFRLYASRITSSNYCLIYYDGDAAGTITWSHAGDGSAVRGWLGGGASATTNVTVGNPFPTYIPASYVATYGATRAHRSETTRDRGHHIAVSGASWTQHHTSQGDADRVLLDVELWSGNTGGTNSRNALSQFETFVDALFDEVGGGEPFSLFASEHDDGSDAEQWVLRFTDAPLRVVPERMGGARPDRLWRIAFRAAAEVVPW